MTEDQLDHAPSARDALEEVRRQLFALCEDTQEQCHAIAQRDHEGKHGAYARGRCYEAKSIARAMSDVFRELISSASLVEASKSPSEPAPPQRDTTKLPASELSIAELAAEQTRVEKLWDEMFEPDEDGEVFEGHGGSPGEWMQERMDEIATEQARRKSPSETD